VIEAGRVPDFDDQFEAGGVTVRIRPIRAEDREREAEFVRNLSPSSRYFRFHSALRELTPQMLERFTQVSYPDNLALVALVDTSAGDLQIGVARYVREPGTDTAEIAIVVADDWQGRGVATRLLTDLRDLARAAGITHLVASVLRENGRMLELVRKLGYRLEPSDDFRASRLGKPVDPQRSDD
jgi:acetyltransferase